ncbi:MAG: hypothetical protein D6788_02920, partial [Planctomycetota bacterium]
VGKKPGAAAPDDSTKINIPPVENNIPPEERTYMFSIKDGTYEQLVEGFARQTGLGVVGEAPKGGKVTFVSTQPLSFQEALSRIRMLLFNYKPLEPYWIDRKETHLEVSRMVDLPRRLGPERMFRSVEEFRAANLPDDELALVVFTPKSGSVADLKRVRDYLPDYVRVAPIEETNSVTIFALVKDIKKYLWLVKFFGEGGKSDPRTIERIPIKHITPSEAVERLGTLMDLDGGGVSRSRPRTPGRVGHEASPLDILREPALSILPDDVQGVLIVRAMQDKIEEIRKLLPYVDVAPEEGDRQPVVIPVHHTDPDALISTIMEVLSAYPSAQGGGGASPASKRPSPARRPGTPMTAQSTGGRNEVTLVRHPSQEAIIVIADAEGIERVKALAAKFDVPGRMPVRIPVKHADPTVLSQLVPQMLTVAGDTKSRTPLEPYKLVPDPANDALWFTGSERYLKRVQEVVEALDKETEGVGLHSARLRHQQASFVAGVLKEMEAGRGGTVPPISGAGAKRGRAVGPAGSVSKFTPDDEHNVLYVICSESEWEEYRPVIEQIDQPVEGTPAFVRLPVKNIPPGAAMEQLLPLVESKDPRKASARLTAAKDAVFVFGADETTVENLRALLAEIDQPAAHVEQVFTLHHAEASQVKAAVEALVGEEPSGRPGRPGQRVASSKGGVSISALPLLTVVEMGDRLLVRTTPDKMKEVADLVARLDVPDEGRETRLYEDFEPGVDVEEIADTLAGMFGGTPMPGGKSRSRVRGGSPEGARFVPFPRTHKLMVFAPPEMYPEIESALDLLRKDVTPEEPLELAFLPVEHADPADLIDQIEPLLTLKLQEWKKKRGGTAGQGGRRPAGTPSATSDEFHLSPDLRNHRIVVAAPRFLIDYARELVTSFDAEGEESTEVVFKTVRLNHASATEMVKALREMLGTKGGGPARRVKRSPTSPAAPEPEPLTVVEAPGGGAVVLHGPRTEVEEATTWVERLDAIATSGRRVKVYDIQHADIKQLGDLILAVVDRPSERPGVRLAKPVRRPGAEEEPEESDFELTKTWEGHDVYMQADLIGRTLIVATNEANLARVDEIVQKFDADVESALGAETTSVPQFVFELKNADAIDAEFTAGMVLDQLWPEREKPRVEAALFGNALIVRYPDESRFDEIRELLRKYVDVLPPEYTNTKQREILPPQGMSPMDFALWIKMYHPELDIQIQEEPVERESETYGLEVVRPHAPRQGKTPGAGRAPSGTKTQTQNGAPCVLPVSVARTVEKAVLATAAAQVKNSASSKKPAGTKKKRAAKVHGAAGGRRTPPDILDRAQRALMGAPGEETPEEPGNHKKPRTLPEPARKLKIIVNNETGTVRLEGAAGVVDEAPEWIEEIKEEIETLPKLPDIRVVRLRYIDVYTAAEILEDMFNATRQQRAALAAAQRRRPQQPQQRGRGEQGTGREGQRGARRPQPQPGQLAEPRA